MLIKPFSKLLALLLAKGANSFGFFKNRRIWVIGASGGKKYTDNGAALYRYILKNHQEVEIYWIINSDADDISRVKSEGPFLYRNTLKANLYTLLAEVLIGTHSLPTDVSEYDVKRYKKALKVFISHGIEGFKVKAPHHAKIHRDFDISVSVSEFEKNIKVNSWGLSEDKVCITGLPRYDILEKRKKEKRQKIGKIFYMPTWCPEYRKSFEKKYQELTREEISSFKKEEYFQKIHEFINHPEMLCILKEEGISLTIFFHQSINPFMEKIVTLPDPSRMRIAPNGSNIQKILINSDMLITDYSSVAWDFLYLDRPIIFFQFDREKHKKVTGSYLQIPEELFGAATENVQDTVQEIRKITQGEDNYALKREESRKKFIKYHDGRNCERMVNCILEKLNRSHDRRNAKTNSGKT